MANKRYKTKSDYTLLRNKHKSIDDGTIFENDFMTISKMDEYFSEKVPVFSDSNFKFTVRPGSALRKRHRRGNWLCPDGSDSDTCTWTLENTSDSATSSQNIVKIKPDYTSLKDFAYYGSCVDLIHGTLNDITLHFPGELYFSNEEFDVDIEDGKTFYIVNNPFEIDIYSLGVSSNKVDEPLRYFALSAYNYTIISKDGEKKYTEDNKYIIDCYLSGETTSAETLDVLGYCTVDEWEVENYNPGCKLKSSDNGTLLAKVTLNGTFVLYVYYYGGRQYVLFNDESYIDYSIRPKKDIVTKYFETLDPLPAILLNRQSFPVYTAKFETPRVTNKGHFYKFVDYTFPSINSYNPNINGFGYETYVSSLISLATYHDEYDTDIIWRVLTHEAIKNLDWTFFRENGSDVDDMSSIDSTRIESMLKLYGRQYDDLKMAIDSIKTSRTVTYNEKNNMPDYELSDQLEINGWEGTTNLSLSNDKTLKSSPLYACQSNGYSSDDADLAFLRRLKLNTNYILNSSGTRHGIDALMALFGFDRDEYEINEYVQVASADGDFEHMNNEITNKFGVKYPLYDDIAIANTNKDRFIEGDENEAEEGNLAGIPLNTIYLSNESGETQGYVVPWFNKSYEYDGDLYFQMAGGWSNVNKMEINLGIAPDVKYIKHELTDKFKLFNETQSTVKFVNDLNDLLDFLYGSINENDICYVTDITDVYNKYGFKDEAEENAFKNGDFSHYFILANGDMQATLGYLDNGTDAPSYGWRNILTSEFTNQDNLSEDGKYLLYQESIRENTIGNNPHIGNARYDSGKEYLDYMANPFKWALDNDNFSVYDDTQVEKISKYKFDLKENLDNRKCWYFTGYEDSGLVRIDGDSILPNDDVEIGSASTSNFSELYDGNNNKTELAPFNPEKEGKYNSESAANSIINVKKFVFHFKPKHYVKKSNDLFINSILSYLERMIPSTAIFELILDEFDEISQVTTQTVYPLTPTGRELIDVIGDNYIEIKTKE